MGEWVTIILTFALVMITGLYCYFTWRIVVASERSSNSIRDQIRAQTRPYVSTDLIASSQLLELVVTNSGLTAAKDIKIQTSPQIEVFRREEPGKSQLISKGISFLAPHREEREFIGSYSELCRSGSGKKFQFFVSYCSNDGTSYSEDYLIDLSYIDDRMYIGRTTVEKELKKLNQTLDGCQRHLSEIAASSRSTDDI